MFRTIFSLAGAFALAAAATTGQPAGSSDRDHLPDSSSAAVVRTASDSPLLSYDAGAARVLLSRKETGGRYSLMELAESPGYRTPLHVHRDFDEGFYVLEGTLTARIGDKTYEFPAGSFVMIPRGTPHAQGNFGTTPVRVLLTVSPGGFEQFFLDRIELFKTVKPGHSEFEKRITAIIEKNKIDVIGPWQP